jgi:outer membrane protein W
MKSGKTVLSALAFALLTATIATAQPKLETKTENSVENPFRKGRYVWDANLSLTSSTTDQDDQWETEVVQNRINADFRIGYTFIANLETGFSFGAGYGVTETDAEQETETTSQSISLQLFSRYYFLQESRYRPFIGFQGGYGRTESETDNGGSDTESDYFTLGGEFGFVYMINDQWGIESLYSMNQSINDSSDTLSHRLSLGLIIAF